MDTATNNEFYERQSIEEFLGEHEVVKELYEVVRQRPDLYLSESTKLRIFNSAYYICMRLTDRSGCPVYKVLRDGESKWFDLLWADKSCICALVHSLLLMHSELVSFDQEIFPYLKKYWISDVFDWEVFERVVEPYCGTLTKPFNFSGLPGGAPLIAIKEPTDPMQLLERAASDLKKAEERMKAQLATKDQRIVELIDQVKEEQAKGQAKEDRIKELEEQNARLANNPFCLVKIKDYAKGIDKEEAKVITHMLMTIALEEQLPKMKQVEVRKAVKEVNEAHKQQPAYVHIERQEIHNDNKNSQVFNGPITDSNFK